jgi:hypothetical protein
MAQRSSALWIDVGSELTAEQVSWFAIRQPAVVKMLERELWTDDGDAFAVALDAVCRVAARVAELDDATPPRLSRELLEHGLAMSRSDGVDTALARWVRWCVDAAPVVLTGDEERLVLDCVGALLWAIAAADLVGLDRAVGDTLLA